MNAMDTLLTIQGLECRYDGQVAVAELSLSLREAELACLLGPSGCGKTTVLRAVAGFEPVFGGEIRLGGQLIANAGGGLAPDKRRVGMVFQDYALFPHLTVADNVAFGLSGRPRRERRATAAELLDLVGLSSYGERFPHELSGGQQQRVALARAMAPRPRLLLMDEPFSNLDVDLRERLIRDVRDILKRQGTAAIFVTHDQHEAFILGERIGVMREGRILQWDTPFNLYHEPVDRFVADFVGQGRFVGGILRAPDTLDTELGVIRGNVAYGWPKGSRVELLLRPDDVVIDAGAPLQAEVTDRAFKGAETLYTLKLASGAEVLSLVPSHQDHSIGERVGVRAEVEHFVAFKNGV